MKNENQTPATKTPKEAEAEGFATFNNAPHLCVDVPNGHFTITCKQSNGKRITFAFVPYSLQGGDIHPAGCVDVHQEDCPTSPILFNDGGTLFHFQDAHQRPATLASFVLDPEAGA